MTNIEQLAQIAAKFAPTLNEQRATVSGDAASIVARKGDDATVYLYDAITPAYMGGLSAKSFVDALSKEAKGAKTLNVRINSPGGVIHEAKAIYTALKAFPGRKVVHVDGLAASAATFIAMAGDEIRTAPEATWFIHGAQGMTMGDANAHREIADVLDMESANIAAIYAKRTGQKVEDLRKMMDDETFMTAAEAKAKGFTDAIDGEEEEKKKSAPPHRMDAATKILALRAYTQELRNLRAGACAGAITAPAGEE
jgi:ATP-dependent Clp protease protease subunit